MPSTVAENPVVNPASIDENYVHVVAALIWRGSGRKQFLIAQRQKGKHLEDYWEFPGGKLEADESAWQGLQRELKEEVNIQPIKASPFIQVYYRYPDRNILLDTWAVEEYAGKIRPREQQAIRWIDLNQIDGFRFPPADIPILEAIRSSVTAGT
jgi:8-oxo-dGTP diphosphatase